MFIPDPDPDLSFPDPTTTTKERGDIFVLPFRSNKFHIIGNYFIFELV